MGAILANSGPNYRKELPLSAPQKAAVPATAALLTESVELWERYMDMCLHPDRRIAAKHAIRISNSLKIIASSLFANGEKDMRIHYLEPFLKRLKDAQGPALFALVDSLAHVPLDILEKDRLAALVDRLEEIRGGSKLYLGCSRDGLFEVPLK